MTWITQNWTSGQLNALVKKIGGEEVARGILDGSLVFKIEKPTVSPFSSVWVQVSFAVLDDSSRPRNSS